MTRKKGKGLCYLRRSSHKQEISLETQLEWSQVVAAAHGIPHDVTLDDLLHMQNRRLHAHKCLRLDDGISGSDLTRPGFLAFIHDALTDPTISHVFFYKRDRFARPDVAMEAAQLELKLLRAGITIVHSDGVSKPIRRGEQSFMKELEPMFAYYQSGEELRKHAERMIVAHRKLAEGGFWSGGRAPFGFARVLVDPNGNFVEELLDGKTIRQPGYHVRIVPKDFVKIAVWLQILEWKSNGLGYQRIAKMLNAQGTPSPNAGRSRRDHGVLHLVSGRWNKSSVSSLCNNAAILGILEHGARSNGKLRRLGKDGPRLLTDNDLNKDGKPRMIVNDVADRIVRKTGDPQFDPERWKSIQDQTRERALSGKGIPRAKDPAHYPLSCRLVDLTEGCGAVFHGRKLNDGRRVYTCGRYLQTSSLECYCNQVDAEAMLRFTLGTLRQYVELSDRRTRLRELLVERARNQALETPGDHQAQMKSQIETRKEELLTQASTIEYRMAREHDDELYKALSRQFQANQRELEALEQSLHDHAAMTPTKSKADPETEADAAMSYLDNFDRIITDPTARAEINPILVGLGMRIGLTFVSTIKGKKRVVRRLLSGRIVFRNDPLPVPLFGRHNLDEAQSAADLSLNANQSPMETEVRPANNLTQTKSESVERRNDPLATKSGKIPDKVSGRVDHSTRTPSSCQQEGISITKGHNVDT